MLCVRVDVHALCVVPRQPRLVGSVWVESGLRVDVHALCACV